MRLLLISSSTVHGYGYLDQPEPEMRSFLGRAKHIAFVPFAIHDREAYTAKVRERLGRMGFEVQQVGAPGDLDQAEAVFVGGGNTFRLLKALYETKTLEAVRRRVRAGMPYIGASAGSNVAGLTIKTTNDMPIVYPPSFDALGLVPFQINPHYLDTDPASTHMGETREQRIREFLEENATPVVAIREGSAIKIENGSTRLVGIRGGRIFRRNREPEEIEADSTFTV